MSRKGSELSNLVLGAPRWYSPFGRRDIQPSRQLANGLIEFNNSVWQIILISLFVRFAPEASESYLPRSEELDLYLVLLDGKHAFPWPVIDWIFTAD
jgi:hypothetical protein